MMSRYEELKAKNRASTFERATREMPQVIAGNPGKDVKFDYDCCWFEVTDAEGLFKVVHLGGWEEPRREGKAA